MRYFKIIRGYKPDDYIEIDETELKKAQYCFMLKKDAVYSGGAVRGSEMKAIQPDYQRSMGWNRGYAPLAEDWGEIRERGVDRECRNLIEAAKEEVRVTLASGRPVNAPNVSSGGFLPESSTVHPLAHTEPAEVSTEGELQDPRITKMRNEFIEKSRMLPPQKKAEAQEEAARQDRQDKG